MAARYPEDSISDDNERNCLICMEPYVNPKALPCHHTFCTECLEKYLRSFTSDSAHPSSVFPCPTCRYQVPVPSKGLENTTPKDPDEEQEAEPSEAMKELVAKISSSKRVPCDVCKYKKIQQMAIDHCMSCSINYCQNCAKDHRAHQLFQSHSVIPVTEMDRSALRCEIHDAEHVKYFCADCLAPLCTVCAVSNHVNHKTMELNDALGNKKETIQTKISGMSDKVMKHEQLLLQLEDISSVREAAKNKTRLEIERHVNSIIAQVHAKKQILLDELDRGFVAGVKQINLEKENCAFQLANMKSLWKFAAKLTEPTQQLQLLAMHNDLTKMVDSMVLAADPKLAKECVTIHMFMPKEHLTVGELQRCELSPELLSRISEVGDLQNGVDVTPSHAPAPHHHNYFEPMNLKWHPPKLLWKVDKLGAKTGEINEAYDVTITPNGTVIAAEWLNQRLQIFDVTGYSRDIIGHQQMQPWGVAMTREGNLAVTDEKDRTVKVFSPQGNMLQSWKKMLFGWPRGLCINRAGHFVVTDTQHGRHTVSLHLPDGQCIRSFGSQGSGNEQFHWPRYVTVDQQDRIIVSDSSNHCIKVLDPTGQFIFKFGSIGSGDGHMKHPRGICIDPNNNILIADQDNNRVSLFNQDGKFIRQVLAIQRPWGVALSEGGLLAVTQKPALSLYKVFEPMP